MNRKPQKSFGEDFRFDHQQEHKFDIDECTACEKKFDKSTPDSAEWRVIVRKKSQQEFTTRFYCPQCWNDVETFIKENTIG